MDVHKGGREGGVSGPCGQRGGGQKPNFFVDIINGWPLRLGTFSWIVSHLKRSEQEYVVFVQGMLTARSATRGSLWCMTITNPISLQKSIFLIPTCHIRISL